MPWLITAFLPKSTGYWWNSSIQKQGTRFMSSNYDPIPLWLAGCQMVALNYQAQDKPLAFNRALFRSNGQCGYILKPEPLLNGNFFISI